MSKFWCGILIGAIAATLSAYVFRSLGNTEQPLEYHQVCHKTGPDVELYDYITPDQVKPEINLYRDCERKIAWAGPYYWSCHQQHCEVARTR
jgi:hypothetical protein